jgi:chromosome segregation ATPase
MSGLDVFGAWAAGDAQALRALVVALMEVADGATARVDRARRQVDDLTAGQKHLRDQLREALDDLEAIRSDREEERADIDVRVGQMMAEITKLKANLGAATVQQAMAPELAEVIRERDLLRKTYAAEKLRADEAVAARQEYADEAVKEFNEMREQLTPLRMQVLALTHERDQLRQEAVAVRQWSAVYEQAWRGASDAANAADQAFEEAKWKEGARYLRLASMWINLLDVAGRQEKELK